MVTAGFTRKQERRARRGAPSCAHAPWFTLPQRGLIEFSPSTHSDSIDLPYTWCLNRNPSDPTARGFRTGWHSRPLSARVVPVAITRSRRSRQVEDDPMSAVEAQIHLSELLVERALALIEGLAANGAYMADLDDEIAATRHAYIAAAITDIATLRAELSAPNLG